MQQENNNKIILGYWPGAGRGQPARYLLELAGAKYEDVRYTNRDDWFVRDKHSLGLPFPNLPYLIDGDVKLTESETIFDYLIQRLNKTELLGKDQDKFIVDLIRNLLADIANKFGQIFNSKDEEEKAKILNEQIVPKLRYLHKYLGNKEYFVGYLTAADIYFLNYGNLIRKNQPLIYKEFADTFDPLLARLNALPQIAAYIAEGRHPQ